MKMDSLDSLTYGGVRGRENLFNFPSYSILFQEGIKILSDGTLVAITLMIAESKPEEKDVNFL